MATLPHPAPPRPAAPAAAAPKAPAPAKPAEPDPPVQTIADEQRERSAEIERMGSAAWVEAHDERSAEEKKPRAVGGIAQPDVEAFRR
jgi:hypothetical protein